MTSPLKVAHVLRKYDDAELGGTETHVQEITRRLSRHGVDCEVHAPAGPRGGGALAVPLVRYRAFCPFVGSAERRRALWATAGNLVSLEEPLRLARDRSLSLVHLHTGGRIGGGVRTAMRLTGRPYVVSVHGPLFSGEEFLAADTARRRLGTLDVGRPLGLLFGARRVIGDAARVLCFNDEEYRALQARIGTRAVRMDHGVDRARFQSGVAARARRRWPSLGTSPIVLQVGRLCVQKDQLLAMRAFAAGAPRDHLLVFAGPETDPGYRACLEAEARALGIAQRLHFLGAVDPDAVADLLAAASLCLAPSQHEAFGLLVLEAWAAGRPALFARVGGLADLAQALGSGAPALCVREPRAWALALAALLGDAQGRSNAAAAGAALLTHRFSWDRAAAALADLYRDVLAERTRRVA